MEEFTKGLIFRNKQLQAEEFYGFEELADKTFDQIALDLWDRQRRKNVGFRSDVEAPERGALRQPAKFSYKPPTGTGFLPINGSRGVLEFLHDTGAREVLYFFEPLGGSSAEAFASHAREVCARPRDFGTWTLGSSPEGLAQLEKVVLDKDRRVVRVRIRPTARYPESPPQVVTKPRVHDACFSFQGELHWAQASETGQLIWSEHAGLSNPLAQLLDELRRKYHVF